MGWLLFIPTLLPAKVTLLIRRFAIAWFPILALVAACGADEAPQLNNWADLCARMDCEQFPVGHMTERIGDAYFYSRIHVFSEKDLARAAELYIERDEHGRPKRAALLSVQNQIGFYCNEWRLTTDRLGLPSSECPSHIHYRLFDLAAVGIPSEFRDSPHFASIESLQALNLPSFDSNFWLLHGGTEPLSRAGMRHDLILVSKTPLLFGRHVWVDCNTVCDVETVTFPADPQAGVPNVTINGFDGYLPEKDRASGRTCDACLATPETFAIVPQRLRQIEQVFQRLQEKPQT